MSVQDNKTIARQFCERFTAGDIPGVLALMADDIHYWILGRRDVTPSAGSHTKAEMEGIFRAMQARMPEGVTFTAKSVIGEGDEVALEAESHGKLTNGRVYNNQYHIRMRIREGKIAEAREYLDTQHVYATWFAA